MYSLCRENEYFNVVCKTSAFIWSNEIEREREIIYLLTIKLEYFFSTICKKNHGLCFYCVFNLFAYWKQRAVKTKQNILLTKKCATVKKK